MTERLANERHNAMASRSATPGSWNQRVEVP
jgi:hypothetical protein